MINLRSLDGLRGLLACYVVIHHARWLLWCGQENWISEPHPIWAEILAKSSAVFRYGNEAVMVFFVLSGFFIHLRAARQLSRQDHELSFSPSRYLRRRAHRLLPPYFFALLFTLSIDLIGRNFFPTLYAAETGDALLDGNFEKKGYTWNSVLPAVFLLPSSRGEDFGTNGPLWSIAFEIVYYALYPLWLMVRRRSREFAFGAGVAVSVFLLCFPCKGFLFSVLVLYPIWLAGAFLAELACTGERDRKKLLFAGFAMAAMGFAGLQGHGRGLLDLLANMAFSVGIVAIFVAVPLAWNRKWPFRFWEELGREAQ